MKKAQNKIALLLAAAMVVTGIQVPVYGATEETVTVTEVAEEAVEMNEVTEDVTEVTEDAPVGADSTIYVRSAAELVNALNDENLPTNEKIQIQLEAPLAGSDNYMLTKELLGGKNLTIKEGADITLDLNDYDIRVSDNAAEYNIEIPKDTSLSIIGKNERDSLCTGIVNYGSLNITNISFAEFRDRDRIVNHAEATANLENINIGVRARDVVAVKNAGTMTIADGSNIEAGTYSFAAIENTGEMQINRAEIASKASTVSSCGIKNIGANANLSIRGGEISSYAYGIYNDAGTVTIGGYVADTNQDTSVAGNVCAALTVNSGAVICYEGMKVTGGVATTPFAGSDVCTGTTDGVFKMLGGTVEQVIYSADSLPILIGGTVGNKTDTSAQALNLLIGKKEAESDLSKYTYLTGEAGTPVAGTYTADGGATKVAYAIVDGKVYHKSTEGPEDNGILVTSEAQLRNAVVSGGSIKLQADITLTQSLEFTKDVNLSLVGYTLTQGSPEVAITVAEGVNAEIAGGTISFANMKTGASALTNSGNLTLNYITVSASPNSEDVTGAVTITNQGTLELVRATIETKVKNGIAIDNAGTLSDRLDGGLNDIYGNSSDGTTAIRNSGTCTLQSSVVFATSSGASHCTAVYNTGKFIMKAGLVQASRTGNGLHNYAIVYTGEHYPILQGCVVLGAAYAGAVSANDLTYGSAVVKAEGNGVYSRGYYQISDSEPVSIIDGKNSWVIINGVAEVQVSTYTEDTYLLLQRGDVVTKLEDAFKKELSFVQGVTYSITSENPEVASVTSSEEDGKTTWTLSANKTGYTTLKATVTLNGDMTIEDYLRVEVTDDKAALTAEDYEGSLLENQVVVNAYAKDNIGYKVPFEFHLNTSDMETATGATYSEAQNASFEVSEIIIDDKEFNEYFKCELYIPNRMFMAEGINKKQCIFAISNKTSNNDASTKLLDDEVKSIDQVEVKAKITNKASNKDIVISLGYLDIQVQAVKPVVKANGGFTLNSAYSADAKYYDDNKLVNVYPNRKSTTPLTAYVTATVNGEELVNGVSIKFLSDGISGITSNSYITANVKKGKETITAEAKLDNYVGSYEVNIPVTVTNKYPKVSLDKKTVTVASKSSAETDIPLYLYAKDAESAGMVEDVEIVTAKGKTSNYTVVKKNFGRTYYDKVSKTYNTREFYLQPKNTVNKAETVTLKVTYKETNAKAGKAYSTTVKVKIKPVNKFTIKQNGKASMSTTAGYGTDVYIKTTPEYFQGAKLVVTALNGQTEIPEEVAGAAIESNGNGTHELELIATEATKSRGKKLEFGVAWVDETGKTLTGTKTAKMTVSLYDDTAKITSLTPSITVQPEKIYKKVAYTSSELNGLKELDESNTTCVEYTTPVKFTGTGVDAWGMTKYSDNMFKITYEAKKIILTATNEIIGGTQYTIPLEFVHGRTGETQTVNLTVKVNDIKKVSAKFNIDTVTLYKKAPYVMQSLMTALGNTYMANPAGGAGLTEITNVEIVDAENSPFEIYEYETYSHIASDRGQYNVKDMKKYGITFKDKKYPANASAKSLKSVTLKITYGNGIDDNYKTATVKLKVNVK